MEVNGLSASFIPEKFQSKVVSQPKLKANKLANDQFYKTGNANPGFGSNSVNIIRKVLEGGENIYHMVNKKGLLISLASCGASIVGIGLPKGNGVCRFFDLTKNEYEPNAKNWESKIIENGVQFTLDNTSYANHENAKAFVNYTFEGDNDLNISYKIMSNNINILNTTIIISYNEKGSFYKTLFKKDNLLFDKMEGLYLFLNGQNFFKKL